MELFRSAGDLHGVLKCRNRLAWTFMVMENISEQKRELDSALVLARVLDGGRSEESIQTYLLCGFGAFRTDSLDVALAFASRGLDVIEARNVPITMTGVQLYNLMGSVYQRKGGIDSALVYLEKGLNLSRTLRARPNELAYSMSLVGDLKRQVGQPDTAIAMMKEAMELLKKAGVDGSAQAADLRARLGAALYDVGDFESAVAQYDTELVVARQIYGEDHGVIAATYLSLAEALTELGEYSQAASCLRINVAHSDRPFWGRNAEKARTHEMLARNLLGQDSLREAAIEIQKAIEIETASSDTKRMALTKILEASATIARREGRHADALRTYEQIRKILRQIPGADGMPLAQTLLAETEAYMSLSKLDSAEICLNQAIDIGGRLAEYDAVLRSSVHRVRGTLYEKNGEAYRAISSYDSAMSATQGAGGVLDVGRSINTRDYLAAALLKARLLFRESGKDAGSTGLNDSLLLICRNAVLVVERRRALLRENDSKLQFTKFVVPFCEMGIEASLRLHSSTHSSEYLESAFAFAEYSKSRVLLDAVERETLLRAEGIPGEMMAREHDLVKTIASLDVRLQRQPAREKPEKISGLTLEVNRVRAVEDLARLRDSIRQMSANAGELMQASTTVNLARIRRAIPENSCLVEYFRGDSTLTAFVCNKERLSVVRLGSARKIERLVDSYLNGIRTVKPDEYVSSARQLYRHLIRPLESFIGPAKELVIVPEWSLPAIPFEALLASDVSSGQSSLERDFRTLPYLVRRYAVSYSYSATFFSRSSMNSRADGTSGQLIAFAPMPGGTNTASTRTVDRGRTRTTNDPNAFPLSQASLSDLEFSRDEVTSIGRLFKNAGKTAQVYLGTDANKERFTASCGSYDFVHLATHGFMPSYRSSSSGLIFTDKDSTGREVVVPLYGDEAYALQMRAKLVVLSSCESGLGPVAKGEGVLSLTRGFFSSGAQNVMCSLWRVLDRSSRDLMVEFYGNVLQGKSYSKSIQHAKLDLIRDEATAYPREWAGFVLMGK
jgi:CHAT domain-containing protein/tetratricopeptide (TPR) repeat protein